MQITKRDQKLLIVLACVLLLAGAYKFGYLNYGDKRAAIEQENDELRARYDSLCAKNQNREKYKKETEENDKKIEEVLAKYPSELHHDNEIFFTKMLEDATKVKVVQASLTEPESFYLGSEQETPNDITGMQTATTLSVESDYEAFKKLLTYMTENESRKVIQNISLSYNNKSGNLSGTIQYNNYSLVGTKTEYRPYSIPAAPGGQGVGSLFGELAK